MQTKWVNCVYIPVSLYSYIKILLLKYNDSIDTEIPYYK